MFSRKSSQTIEDIVQRRIAGKNGYSKCSGKDVDGCLDGGMDGCDGGWYAHNLLEGKGASGGASGGERGGERPRRWWGGKPQLVFFPSSYYICTIFFYCNFRWLFKLYNLNV